MRPWARAPVPEDIEAARAIWADYSARWQVINQIRTVASGVALLLAGMGTLRIAQAAAIPRDTRETAAGSRP